MTAGKFVLVQQHIQVSRIFGITPVLRVCGMYDTEDEARAEIKDRVAFHQQTPRIYDLYWHVVRMAGGGKTSVQVYSEYLNHDMEEPFNTDPLFQGELCTL